MARRIKALTLVEPVASVNADNLSVEVSSELVRSVRYWPEDSGLQFDMFMTPDDRLGIIFSILGEYFDEWADEVVSICSSVGRFSQISMKERDDMLRVTLPQVKNGKIVRGEVFELQPFGDSVPADPEDFDDEFLLPNGKRDKDREYMQALKYAQTIPQSRTIQTLDIVKALTNHPNSFIRTILRPIPEADATKFRLDLFMRCPELQERIDINASVLNCRCFFGNGQGKVSVELKRILTGMSSDTMLSKLDATEFLHLTEEPLKAVENYARISLTAASFLRIPALDWNNVPKIVKPAIEVDEFMEFQELYYEELEKRMHKQIEMEVASKFSDYLREFAGALEGSPSTKSREQYVRIQSSNSR